MCFDLLHVMCLCIYSYRYRDISIPIETYLYLLICRYRYRDTSTDTETHLYLQITRLYVHGLIKLARKPYSPLHFVDFGVDFCHFRLDSYELLHGERPACILFFRERGKTREGVRKRCLWTQDCHSCFGYWQITTDTHTHTNSLVCLHLDCGTLALEGWGLMLVLR